MVSRITDVASMITLAWELNIKVRTNGTAHVNKLVSIIHKMAGLPFITCFSSSQSILAFLILRLRPNIILKAKSESETSIPARPKRNPGLTAI